jgi:hypothetical protein
MYEYVQVQVGLPTQSDCLSRYFGMKHNIQVYQRLLLLFAILAGSRTQEES